VAGPYAQGDLVVLGDAQEGEVTVSGARAGQPVGGDGYVELTGYAQ
jgi:hypothetical protein